MVKLAGGHVIKVAYWSIALLTVLTYFSPNIIQSFVIVNFPLNIMNNGICIRARGKLFGEK